MGFLRKILLVAALLGLLTATATTAWTAEMETVDGYARQLIQYYYHYQEEATGEIADILEKMEAIDPQKAAVWEKIMTTWSKTNREMPVNPDVLPDGLPEDDSLCIVVLGFGLEPNGAMKPELLDRLMVALRSAEKYPNAYVLCTGGETARVKGVSEAGVMASWLRSCGIPNDRLIVEAKSLSTTENAKNSFRILSQGYPNVSSLAIVSSDYHIRWGSTLFSTVSAYEAGYHGNRVLPVISNAACATDNPQRDSLYSQAWGICLIAGLEWEDAPIPPLYVEEEPNLNETEETQPSAAEAAMPIAAAEPVIAEEEPQISAVLPVVLVLAVIAVFWIGNRKTKEETSGSD